MAWNSLTSDLIYARDTLTVAATAAVSKNVAKTMTMEATPYTVYCTGCSGITATGIDLRAKSEQKVIAVNPKSFY